MKLSDYITVFMIAIAGTILAYFLTNSLLGDPKEKTVSFEYVEPITADLEQPDSELFNAGAINPTVEIYVGSCKDLDQDGSIDEGELVECGQANPVTTVNNEEEEEVDEENEAINRAEGYASGTTAEQRQDVQNQIDEYQQQQEQNNMVVPVPER